MLPRQSHAKIITTLVLILAHFTSSDNPRPVFETVNEQSRIDDGIRTSSGTGILPYGNPLAGNSKQNARIHINNQQAMFNAERIRQHKAQLQRWNNGPQILDSYMKAYHESQENHQLALEQQQATLLDNPVTKATPTKSQRRPMRQRLVQNKKLQPNNSDNLSRIEESGSSTPPPRGNKQDFRRRNPSLKSEAIKITKADVITEETKNRNHRSYGSADYHQTLEPKRYRTLPVLPTPSYDQGVTIKPNSNIGLAHAHTPTEEPSNLYTVAIPSNTKYPHQSQLHNFKSVQEIHALNSLLKKNPTEQLTEFNRLINPGKNSLDINKEIPIDFYFYLKDPTKQIVPQNLDNLKYSQLPSTYASAFMSDYPVKDHTPITEEVDDIEDPNKRPVPLTETPELQTTTTKSNNYYKVELASQTISTGQNPNKLKEDFYIKQENKPHYQTLSYGHQPYYNQIEDCKSEKYLHHSAHPTGVQHLLEDGTQTSAYGDDNVSIINETEYKQLKIRRKRSDLDTEPFLLRNEKATTQPTTTTNSTDTPVTESLIGRNPFSKKRLSDFNVFLSPQFPIGEATDYTDDYDYTPIKYKKPNQKYVPFYDDDDYGNYDDFSSPDYDPIPTKQSFENYAPSADLHLESKGFNNKFRQFRRPNLSSSSHLYSGSAPVASYGMPLYGSPTNIFSTPQSYVSPKFELPNLGAIGNIQNIIEPVYMLTQTQLKELIGNHNLNIEHLDVYQLTKGNKGKSVRNYPRKYRRKNPFKHLRNNLHKLHKFPV